MRGSDRYRLGPGRVCLEVASPERQYRTADQGTKLVDPREHRSTSVTSGLTARRPLGSQQMLSPGPRHLIAPAQAEGGRD
jgi:hypothetical protein